MPIRQLPPEVADKIAAGEVVERPASVAKELIENAIDAGSTEISVEIAQGGRRLIRVSDDGCGIPADQVPLAFARHATSKLETADDLYRVRTLGFRGEALASIGAVSRLTLSTRAQGEDIGTAVRMEGGVLSGPRALGRAQGTSVLVENLFFNTPARLKFLRADTTEAGHVARLASSYALAYPEIRFSLHNNDREVLRTTGTGDLLDALVAVYGPSAAEQMIEVAPNASAGAGEAGVRVRGYISAPSAHRSNRGDITFYVNRRWVQDNSLTYAVSEAYSGLLPQRRYPIVVLNVALPPEDVDVNIHPTKREVRFRRAREVFAAVQRAVRATLVAQSPVPYTTAPQPVDDAWARREMLRGLGQRAWQDLGQQALEVYRTGDREPGAPPWPEATPSAPPAERLPMLRVVGQVAQTYIVAEGPGGLYLIDQHAAHERIRYEEITRAAAEAAAHVAQELLEPRVVEIPPSQAELLGAHLEAFRRVGLELEPFGPHTYLVRRIPVAMMGHDVAAAVAEILEAAEREEPGFSWEETTAVTLACHTAIRAGQTLSPEEMRDLVRRLERTTVPHTCPHGRPTMLHMSQAQLDRQFGRT